MFGCAYMPVTILQSLKWWLKIKMPTIKREILLWNALISCEATNQTRCKCFWVIFKRHSLLDAKNLFWALIEQRKYCLLCFKYTRRTADRTQCFLFPIWWRRRRRRRPKYEHTKVNADSNVTTIEVCVYFKKITFIQSRTVFSPCAGCAFTVSFLFRDIYTEL